MFASRIFISHRTCDGVDKIGNAIAGLQSEAGASAVEAVLESARGVYR
jgi:hypothetical protein